MDEAIKTEAWTWAVPTMGGGPEWLVALPGPAASMMNGTYNTAPLEGITDMYRPLNSKAVFFQMLVW